MTDEINIIRVSHDKENPYMMMNRNTVQDRKLSWEARGVLAYLLSKPDDWKVMVTDLQQGCGREKVQGILRELKLACYLQIIPNKGESGKFEKAEYRIYETPYTGFQAMESNSTVAGKTVDGLPVTGNPPLQSIENGVLNKQNKETSRLPKPKTKPVPKPKNQPVVKPTEKKAITKRKNPNSLEQLKADMMPYEDLVQQMAALCKKGYDPMMYKPGEKLSIKELPKYTLAASEFVRLGCNRNHLKDIYNFIDEKFPERDWDIAPMTIVNYASAFEESIKPEKEYAAPAPQQPPPVRQSPIGGIETTAEQRAKMAASLRERRAEAFGKKVSTQEMKVIR